MCLTDNGDDNIVEVVLVPTYQYWCSNFLVVKVISIVFEFLWLTINRIKCRGLA